MFNIDDFAADGLISNSNIRDQLDERIKIENSKIVIPKLDKEPNYSLMLKISMETKANDNLTIFYKSKQTRLKYYQHSISDIDNYEEPLNCFIMKMMHLNNTYHCLLMLN